MIEERPAEFRILKAIAWCFLIIVSLVICYWLYQMATAFYLFYLFRTSDIVKQDPLYANAYNWSTIWLCLLILFYLLGLLRLNIQVLFKPITVRTAILKLIVIFLLLIIPLTGMLYFIYLH